MAKSEQKHGVILPQKTEKWILQWIPRIVMATFALMLVFVVVAVVVSGLVLGGTIQVDAKAIGLTQSLVLFSAVFSVAYMCLHTYAARKAQYEIDRRQRDQRPLLHIRNVILSRITLGLWATALIAVAITVGSKSATTNPSSLGALRADLAACLINCLCMAIVDAVIERTNRPFVLPWITPPTPIEKQTSSAKALIEDILDDGISGHPTSDANDSVQEKQTVKEERSSSRNSLKPPEEMLGQYPPSYKAYKVEHNHQSTPAERQRLWHQVDEGGHCSPPSIPPAPLPVKTNPQSTSSPRVLRPFSANKPAGSAGSYAALRFAENRPSSMPETAGGKKLFNRAVEGLRVSDSKNHTGTDDWSNVRIPGTYGEW